MNSLHRVAVNEQALEKFLADISLVPNKFPIQEFYDCLMLKWLSVINVSRGNHEVKQLALLIADQVQLESEEPAHGTLTPLRNTLERLVYMDALVLAYPQRCAVNEADACTFAQQHLLDEQGKRDGYLILQFHETIVGNQLRKQMAQMLGNMLQIEMLQTAVAGTMKQNQNYHHFCFGKRPVTMVFPLFCLLQSIFFHHCIKKTAKIIRHTENFRSFLERSEKLCPR